MAAGDIADYVVAPQGFSAEKRGPEKENFWFRRFTMCCQFTRSLCQKSNAFAICFCVANVLVALVGYFRHSGMGFNGWYAVAKCGGYILDFNLSVILVPTLRSIQTSARHIHALDTLFNEDPILFHIRVACCAGLGTLIHVVGHMNHYKAITEGPVFRPA